MQPRIAVECHQGRRRAGVCAPRAVLQAPGRDGGGAGAGPLEQGSGHIPEFNGLINGCGPGAGTAHHQGHSEHFFLDTELVVQESALTEMLAMVRRHHGHEVLDAPGLEKCEDSAELGVRRGHVPQVEPLQDAEFGLARDPVADEM